MRLRDAACVLSRTGPFSRCAFYQRPAWCPRLPDTLLSEYPAWKLPDRTPPNRDLFGLHWCNRSPVEVAPCTPSDAEKVSFGVQLATGN